MKRSGWAAFMVLMAAGAAGVLLPQPAAPVAAQCPGVPTPDPRSTACDAIVPVTVTGIVVSGSGTPSPVAGALVRYSAFGGRCQATSAPDGGVALRGCLYREPCDCAELVITADGYQPWREQYPRPYRVVFRARLVPLGARWHAFVPLLLRGGALAQ